MSGNIIQDKSYRFALRIMKLCFWLKDSKHYEISSQLLRCGTSIGANVEEALAGHSKKDFLHKMNIAAKEARETHYWLRLLKDSGILSEPQTDSIINESGELIKILTSIVKTGQENSDNK
jgi:four helix bundle protein